MARAIKRPPESWRYVLASDRDLPAAKQTTFILRPMTHGERAIARDELAHVQMMPDGSRVLRQRERQQAFDIATSHIVSIENFPVGAPQQWPGEIGARERYLEQLDDDDVLEISNQVWDRSALGVDDVLVGNSSPPEHTSNSGGNSEDESSTLAKDAPRTPP